MDIKKNIELEWFPYNNHICHIVNKKHVIIKTTSGFIRDMEINNWEHNRPPDIIRTSEIAKYYEDDKYIDGIIYLFIGLDNNIYCYDGIHRLSALEEPELSGKDDIVIILDVMKYPKEGLIIERFKSLNKSLAVPQLYINGGGGSGYNLKNTLEVVVGYYLQKYKMFFSSKSNPQVPHENRDIMMDKLYCISEKYTDLQRYNKDEWISFCDKKNKILEGFIHNYKLNEKKKNKCITNRWYLFITKEWHNLYNEEALL